MRPPSSEPTLVSASFVQTWWRRRKVSGAYYRRTCVAAAFNRDEKKIRQRLTAETYTISELVAALSHGWFRNLGMRA